MNKRPLSELLAELDASERETKRLRLLVEEHPESQQQKQAAVRARLPESLGRRLVDSGRLTAYEVTIARHVEEDYPKHGGGLYVKDELRCTVVLDGEEHVFEAYYWHDDRDDCWWKSTDVWYPSPKRPFNPPDDDGWKFLLDKNGQGEAAALASLALLCCEGSTFVAYPGKYTLDGFDEDL